VYGVTTGFGDLANVRIDPQEARRLQENLVVSHAVGVGPPHDRETVRAMLLLRANTLARGQSGCRPEIVERLLDFLRLGVHPVVPEQGSVGASGDLAPLAHLCGPLIGRCQAEVRGSVMSGADALAAAGLEPLRLEAKEGLALLNGTQQMTAVGALTVLAAEALSGTASVVGAMTVEAFCATRSCSTRTTVRRTRSRTRTPFAAFRRCMARSVTRSGMRVASSRSRSTAARTTRSSSPTAPTRIPKPWRPVAGA
jgi:histidine ammonia-lyase